MKKIIVLFSGRASNLENIIKKMHKKSIQITATLTNNKHANGIDISSSNDIPCHIIDETKFRNKEMYNKELLIKVKELEFDLIVLAGYMKIVPSFILDNIRQPIINIHPSLLPLHKGLNGAKKSYEDTNKYGGVSVHYVNSKLDSGEIILQHKIDKTNIKNLTHYEQELSKQEFEILPKAICKVLKI